MEPRKEHNVMACGRTHGPDLGYEGNGQGVAVLGLQ